MSQSALVVARSREIFAPIGGIDQLVERLTDVEQKAFVCCPFAAIDGVPPGWKVSIRSAVINVECETRGSGNYAKEYYPAGEVYRDPLFCEKGEVALTKKGIDKIAGIVGAKEIYSGAVDDGSDPRYCRWQVRYDVRQIDGSMMPKIGTKTIDLRNGSTLYNKMLLSEKDSRGELRKDRESMIKQQCSIIGELAESKASNRALRPSLGLKSKYAVAELKAKPFIAFVLVPDFDMSNPTVAKMVTAHQLGMTNVLYGGDDGPVIDVTALREVPNELPAGKEPPPPVGQGEDDDEELRTGAQAAPPAAEDDMSLFGDPPPVQQDIFICGCICGHQKSVSKGVADGTVAQVGSIRCAECYPGKGFNYPMHKEWEGRSLGMKGRPDITPEIARQMAGK